MHVTPDTVARRDLEIDSLAQCISTEVQVKKGDSALILALIIITIIKAFQYSGQLDYSIHPCFWWHGFR